MGLTLIQSQVLEALVEAVGESNTRRDCGVGIDSIQRELRKLRPRPQSDRYIARILRDLDGQRIGGLRVVELRRSRRMRYVVLQAGVKYVEESRERRRHRTPLTS